MASSGIAGILTVSNREEFKKKGRKQTIDGKFRFDLDCCSKNKDLKGALALYDAAISQNISLSHYHFNALLYLCSTHASDYYSLSEQSDSSKALSLEYGFRIFDHMLSKNITPNEATITSVARLAAAKGDGKFAFELVKTMHKYNALPRLRTYDPALFCFCGKMEADMAYEVEEHMSSMGLNAEELEIVELLQVSMKSGSYEKVYNYLHKLRSSVGCVSDSTAEIIERWFSGQGACLVGGEGVNVRQIDEAMSKNGGGWHGLGWLGHGEWTIVRSSTNVDGFCGSCSGKLVCVDIDAKDTERFEHSIAQLAMEREAKSNFGKFQAWLENHGAHEAIIDGANIGLYQQNFADGGFSFSQLDAVVQELYSMQKKWPLVILHNKRLQSLLNSPARKNVEEWISRGKLYATPNGSNDDWYWIYAAVRLKCLLVTNDEMRDHIFELLGRSFMLKWKERHQVHYTFIKGDLKLQMPPSYSIVIQESKEGSWHVPIASEHLDECSRSWLCIARN